MFQSRSSQCKGIKFFNTPIMEYKVINVNSPIAITINTCLCRIAHIQFFKRRNIFFT